MSFFLVKDSDCYPSNRGKRKVQLHDLECRLLLHATYLHKSQPPPFDLEFVDASNGPPHAPRLHGAVFPDLPRIVDEAGMSAPPPLVRRLGLQSKLMSYE